MEYNWSEIFKNKTSRELYNIYLGNSSLGSEVIEFARIELKNRNFDFENQDKQRQKWELENLIEEERSYSYPLFPSIKAWQYIFMGFFGLLFTSIALISIIIHLTISHNPNYDMTAAILALVFGTAFTLIGFTNYKKKRKREQFRDKRIKELINKI